MTGMRRRFLVAFLLCNPFLIALVIVSREWAIGPTLAVWAVIAVLGGLYATQDPSDGRPRR